MFVGARYRVLGIDPGLTRCGYAVIDASGPSSGVAVALGVIRTPPKDALPWRLAMLREELCRLITDFTPDVVAVEQVFFQVNVRTAMGVGQASGLALAEAAHAGCDVVQYTPNQVKDAVAGWGAAPKEQVQTDGQGASRAEHRAPTGGRRRRRRPGAVPPGDGADACRDRGCPVIGSLRGEVLERSAEGSVLIDVAGVGYDVIVSPRTFGELEPTSAAFLYIHHHIREDDQTLYGFVTRDERTTFKTLIATHGVGPALAMAILTTYPPAALVDVVANGDVGALKAVPGVGPKTAQRLLVELRDRLSLPILDGESGAGGGAGGSTVGAVREALTGLGYGPEEIRDAVRELPGDGDAATLLRDALKLLGAKRA